MHPSESLWAHTDQPFGAAPYAPSRNTSNTAMFHYRDYHTIEPRVFLILSDRTKFSSLSLRRFPLLFFGNIKLIVGRESSIVDMERALALAPSTLSTLISTALVASG